MKLHDDMIEWGQEMIKKRMRVAKGGREERAIDMLYNMFILKMVPFFVRDTKPIQNDNEKMTSRSFFY